MQLYLHDQYWTASGVWLAPSLSQHQVQVYQQPVTDKLSAPFLAHLDPVQGKTKSVPISVACAAPAKRLASDQAL